MAIPIVIVGGGTAGSTVALQLATTTTRPIIVCEPGEISPYDNESRFFDVLNHHHLVTDEKVTVGSRSLSYVQARAVGGGSAINGMLLSGDEPPYVEGLTSIPSVDDIGDISRALLNSGGRVSRLWWNGGRWNPGRALVHLVEEGRVEWKRSDVVHLHVVDGVVSGVETTSEVIATDCVVMAAGAIASPRLLLRSGLGAVATGIGQNYQDHPSISFSLQRSTNYRGNFDVAVVSDLAVDSGVAGLMIAYERQHAADESTALVSVLLMNPESRGEVRCVNDSCVIDAGLLSESRDREGMRELVRASVLILQSEPFLQVAHSIVGGTSGSPIEELAGMSDIELDQWIASEVAPVSHASGSLSLSVDSRGQLTGVRGIVVADASVLSHVPHETPAAAVTMEARRIGRLLGEDLA